MSFEPRAVILLYHRVASPSQDWHQLCVAPDHFADHMRRLQHRAHPLALQQLGEALSHGRVPNRAVVVTFDDGYEDNLVLALPILERERIPATFFVSAGPVGSGEEFYIDELEHLVLESNLPSLRVKAQGREMSWDLGPPLTADSRASAVAVPRRVNAYLDLSRLLRDMDASERSAVLEQLRGADVRPPAACPRHRTLSEAELQGLGHHELVEVGSHGLEHLRLAGLRAAEQEAEIAGGKQRLEEALGAPVMSLAYPYGSPWDVGLSALERVRKAGFRLACANTPGPVTRASNPWWLPRFIVRDWDGPTFERNLEGFFRPQLTRPPADG